MATDQFGSGGGFSFQFSQANATWQKDAAATYLKTLTTNVPAPSTYAPDGRATPDVSALGEGFSVIVGGRVQSVGGTSASAPTFAGIISLLNEASIAKGGKQLGFLNAWIYQNADAWNDVVKGTNRIGRSGQPLKYGWDAIKGWDAATGLGSPNFQKLLATL